MDIVVRNFFRLLRAGVLHRQELVEPMSAWKWRQLWRLSMLQGVEAEAWVGVNQLHEQFFMRLPDDLRTEWERSVAGHASQRGSIADHASHHGEQDDVEVYNPLTSRQQKRLARIAEEANPRSSTYRALVLTVELANHLLQSDRWVLTLIDLGRLLHAEGHYVDAGQLDEWVSDVGRGRLLQLEGLLLVQLLGLDADDVTFYTPSGDEAKDGRMVEDVVNAIWTTRPNVRFMKYFPHESLTSCTASVVQAIVNVEE